MGRLGNGRMSGRPDGEVLEVYVGRVRYSNGVKHLVTILPHDGHSIVH